ncbi:DUF2599 domain-containing protein [Gordonia sp. CPCC 205515]|uniref:DUF2599 domain-containing protein n=1 Tax=Gordonia sp. CPCC 205515 TaxID=3140791 RepID=UPI003AF34F98
MSLDDACRGWVQRTVLIVGSLAVVGSGLTGCSSDVATIAPSTSSSVVSVAVSPSAAPTSVPPSVTASTTRVPPPPYVDHVVWASTPLGPSLQVYPTPAGRRADSDTAMATAWAEVLRLAPRAATPGMQAQFDCHWTFARAVEPNKPSWNIEPWRPVVTDEEMIATRCNPGGPEE